MVTTSSSSGQGQSFSPSVAACGTSKAGGGCADTSPPRGGKAPPAIGSSCSNRVSIADLTSGAYFSSIACSAFFRAAERNASASIMASSRSFEFIMLSPIGLNSTMSVNSI